MRWCCEWCVGKSIGPFSAFLIIIAYISEAVYNFHAPIYIYLYVNEQKTKTLRVGRLKSRKLRVTIMQLAVYNRLTRIGDIQLNQPSISEHIVIKVVQHIFDSFQFGSNNSYKIQKGLTMQSSIVFAVSQSLRSMCTLVEFKVFFLNLNL